MKFKIQELLKELISYTKIPDDHSSGEALNVRKKMCEEFERLALSNDPEKQKKMITLFMGGTIYALKCDDWKFGTTHYNDKKNLPEAIKKIVQNKSLTTTTACTYEIGKMILASLPNQPNAFTEKIFQRQFNRQGKLIHFFPDLNLHPKQITLLVDFCKFYPKNLERIEVDSEELEKLKNEEKERLAKQKMEEEKRIIQKKREETIKEFDDIVKFYNITLSDKDLKALEADDTIIISNYLEKYLLPLIPKFCEEWKEDSKIIPRDRLQRIVTLSYRGILSSKILDTIWSMLPEEGSMHFAMSDFYGRPITVATEQKNLDALKNLDSIYSQSLKKFPKYNTELCIDLRDILRQQFNGKKEVDCFLYLLTMVERYSENENTEKPSWGDKVLPYKLENNRPVEGKTSLLEFYSDLAQHYVENGRKQELHNLCVHLSRQPVNDEEYSQFRETVFNTVKKPENKISLDFNMATSHLFDMWDRGRAGQKAKAKAESDEKARQAEAEKLRQQQERKEQEAIQEAKQAKLAQKAERAQLENEKVTAEAAIKEKELQDMQTKQKPANQATADTKKSDAKPRDQIKTNDLKKDAEVKHKGKEEEDKQIEKAKNLKRDETVNLFNSIVKFYHIELSDEDRKKFEADDNIIISNYLDKYLLLKIPTLCKDWKSDPRDSLLRLVTSIYRDKLSTKLLDEIWSKLPEEGRMKFALTKFDNSPLNVATENKNLDALKNLDSIYSQSLKKYPQYHTDFCYDLKNALEQKFSGNKGLECFKFLLEMAEKYSDNKNIENPSLSDKVLPYKRLGYISRVEGTTSLLQFYSELAKHYVESSQKKSGNYQNELHSLCLYLSNKPMTDQEYTQFKETVSTTLNKLNENKIPIDFKKNTSELFGKWDVVRVDQKLQREAAEKAAADKAAADKAAADKVAADKVAADKVAADKVAADKVAADKAAADKVAADKAAADKVAADKAAADKVAAEKVAADKAVADKVAADKAAADKVAADKAAADKAAADKAAADKAAADKVAADKAAADKAAADKVAADKVAADKVAADKVAADKVAADKVAADKVAADKVAADKVAADKVAADKVAADKAAADKVTAGKAAADKAAAEATYNGMKGDKIEKKQAHQVKPSEKTSHGKDRQEAALKMQQVLEANVRVKKQAAAKAASLTADATEAKSTSQSGATTEAAGSLAKGSDQNPAQPGAPVGTAGSLAEGSGQNPAQPEAAGLAEGSRQNLAQSGATMGIIGSGPSGGAVNRTIQPNPSKTEREASSVLCDIIDELIDNITNKKNSRYTSGTNSTKIAEFVGVKERLNKANNLSKDSKEYGQYLDDIMKICQKKRNLFHFWQTPHSVLEYQELLKKHQIEYPPQIEIRDKLDPKT